MRRTPNFNLIFGCMITGLTIGAIVLGYFWTPYEPNVMSMADKNLAPCAAHWLGTDNFGRDVLSRVMEGA